MADDSRSEEGFQTCLDRGCPRLQLAPSSSASRASRCGQEKAIDVTDSLSYPFQVIPLARRSGLIEWCEGTVPLGEWLASDTKGAHQRYRPTDLSPNQAKMRLAGARDKGTEKRHAVFTEVCSKIQYVLDPPPFPSIS